MLTEGEGREPPVYVGESGAWLSKSCCMSLLSRPSGPGWWKLLCHLHCAGHFFWYALCIDPNGSTWYF